MNYSDQKVDRNIVIVEDDQANLRFLTDVLERSGYQVRPAIDAALALAAVQSDPPDLILLDIMMPGMDGYEMCELLKADGRTRDIPIIFLSALNRPSDKVKAFAVGGVDYITKPFHIKEVMARVETHLALQELQESLKIQNARLQQEVVERRQAADRLQTMHEIDQSIVAARSPETIAVAAIGRLIKLMPCQRVVVIALTEDGRLQNLAAESSGGITLDMHVEGYREVFEIASLRSGRVYGVPNLAMVAQQSFLQEKLYVAGVRAYVIMPLFVHGDLVGTMHLESTEPHVFTANHIVIASEVAALLAVAIRQARLYELAQQEIAERKQVEEALRQQALELRSRNEELDAFAHTVAHDLKNPLSALIGLSSLLERRYTRMDPAKVKRNLLSISQTGYKMTDIINELLLLASVRKMEDVPLKLLDTGKIVVEAQSRLARMIEKYQVTFLLPAHWPMALGYGPWVEEVWVNYLSNAIKYGGRPPRIELGTTKLPGGMIRFWVRDNGPGIAEEQRSSLFTMFKRLDQTRIGGHGLGLSIVSRIVKKLDGTVGLDSEVGEGSEFFFTLPTVSRQTDKLNLNALCDPDAAIETQVMQNQAALAALKALPSDIIRDLCRATNDADVSQLSILIARVREHSLELAEFLANLAYDFDHEAILALLEAVPHDDSVG